MSTCDQNSKEIPWITIVIVMAWVKTRGKKTIKHNPSHLAFIKIISNTVE